MPVPAALLIGGAFAGGYYGSKPILNKAGLGCAHFVPINEGATPPTHLQMALDVNALPESIEGREN